MSNPQANVNESSILCRYEPDEYGSTVYGTIQYGSILLPWLSAHCIPVGVTATHAAQVSKYYTIYI